MIGDIFQPTHLLFILVVVLIVLGPKRLPETARSLGRGLRDFKAAISGDEQLPGNEFHQQQITPTPSPQQSPTPVSPVSQDPVERPG